MGIYDREYYREEPRGFFLSGDRTMVVNLIIVNAAVFLVDVLLFNSQLSEGMAIQASLFQQPWNAWQLLTSGFAHTPNDIWHVAFNMLALWFFGRELEQIYGRKLFLQLYLSLVVLSSLGWLAVQNLIFRDVTASAYGASGAVSGIMVVYMMHFPMKIIYIWGVVPVYVWILVSLYLLQDFLELRTAIRMGQQFTRIGYGAHLSGALFGLLFYKTGWTLASLVPRRFIKSGMRIRSRPKLRLHSPEQDDDQLDARVDQILDKINREGEASLSRDERRTLEEASRRYQKRRS